MQLYENELARLKDCERGPRATSVTDQQETLILEDAGAAKECQICFDTKHSDLFPQTTAASECNCLSDACLVCTQEHIKSQMKSKEWKEGSTTCPMCNRALTYQEMEDLADSETLAT